MKFDIKESITIDAPLIRVRELIEDFNQWNAWSPWTVLEPSCKVTVLGKPKQPGHSMSWDGKLIGTGQNTLVAIQDEQLNYQLEFLKPFKSKADVSFVFEEQSESSNTLSQTKVTWSMISSMPFFMFFMVKTMKNVVSMDYLRGLKMLKAIAEKNSLHCETIDQGVVDYQGFSYVGIQRSVAIKDMSSLMQEDFAKIINDVVIDGQKGARHWVTIYPKFNFKTMQATYIAAISDEDAKDLQLDSSYISGHIKNSKALQIDHNGTYDLLGNAWSMGYMIIRGREHKSSGYPFEQYWNSPVEVPPEELKTSIYFPVK
jgi:effector-binding domain-containing protein